MASPAEMTYIALRPLRVGGQTRHKGSLVPEARSWHNLEAYIRGGRIAAVPKASVDQDALNEAEEAFEARVAAKTPEEAEPEATEQASDDAETDELGGGAEEDEGDDEPESEGDLEQYHTGNGWYEVPGAEKKMRREEALEFLTSPEDESEE